MDSGGAPQGVGRTAVGYASDGRRVWCGCGTSGATLPIGMDRSRYDSSVPPRQAGTAPGGNARHRLLTCTYLFCRATFPGRRRRSSGLRDGQFSRYLQLPGGHSRALCKNCGRTSQILTWTCANTRNPVRKHGPGVAILPGRLLRSTSFQVKGCYERHEPRVPYGRRSPFSRHLTGRFPIGTDDAGHLRRTLCQRLLEAFPRR